MSNIDKEYIRALSKIVEKIRGLQELVKRVSDIEKIPSFERIVKTLEEISKEIDVLKNEVFQYKNAFKTNILDLRTSLDKLRNKIDKDLLVIIDELRKEIEGVKFVSERDRELGQRVRVTLAEIIKDIKKDLENLKNEVKKYAEELRFTKEGLLKSPGIIGPSASGIEVLLNNLKKGVYSQLNLVAGNNVVFDVSENRQEGRINLTIHSTGGGSGEGGATTFLQLTDTPSSYFTHANELVQVNDSENALQFVKLASLINPGQGIFIEGAEFITISNDGVLSLNGLKHDITLEGTPNQINVETYSPRIVLSTPQDIHEGAMPTFAGLILRKPYGTYDETTAEIRFLELEENGSNYVGFKAPDNIPNNVIWTLPNTDGLPGQVLSTNGSGVLSWKTVPEGDPTIYAIIYSIALG
ncbi:MAG: hypothetical protein ACO2PO_23030 [Candidatus Calescibacterium sp.]